MSPQLAAGLLFMLAGWICGTAYLFAATSTQRSRAYPYLMATGAAIAIAAIALLIIGGAET